MKNKKRIRGIGKKTAEVVKRYDTYVMKTYTRTPLCFDRAKGSRVWDADGNMYLDFFPGWAVSGIGHCDGTVVSSLRKQSGRLLHVSNNYYSAQQGALAQTIVRNSFPGKVFFCNSGAEANEAAIKLARKYGSGSGRYETITMRKSFHGRTLATITATGQDKVKNGFAPLPEGFLHVPFGDLEALKEAIGPKTIAVLLEPIQCEGGINIARKEYLRAIRKLCDAKDIVLILDEVQTGMGRTGKMFCYQHYGIVPDVMTLAKSLGGGLPIGAMVARSKFSGILTPGSHASTFGGSPVVCAAALGVFDAIANKRLIQNARVQGRVLKKRLEGLKKKYRRIKEIRAMALTVGIEISGDGGPIVDACRDRGLLINCTQTNVLRIMPSIAVTAGEIEEAIAILDNVLRETGENGRV
ncbi:MAG: aspartate aminotransferase family protein [Candidatus Omnitrophota bacterium]